MTDGFDLFDCQRRGQILRVNDDVVVAEGMIFCEGIFHRAQNSAGCLKRKTERLIVLFIKLSIFQMKFMQEAVNDGRKDDSQNADQRDAAVNRVTAGENFSAIRV